MTTKGTKVGKYLITSKIAEGGMGAIYKAKHPTLNRDIILKRLTLRQNRSITERFKREAQLMIDFRDDRIVQVYDHFKEGSSYYIAMEFIDGISLGELIQKKRYIPNDIAILIFSEICKALKYAHDKNVIHRDIKPANILISKYGEVKLTDFGIARSEETDETEGLTTEGMTLGTPAYMSPEQISDTKNVDKRADIYSMGVVLYEMVTGKCPFPGSFTPESIALIQKGEYLPVRRINPRVAPVIQKIIKKAMHCKLKKRYKDLQYIISLLSKYNRKYRDQDAVNYTIKEYLQGKQADTTSKSSLELKQAFKKVSDGMALAVSSNLARITIAGILLVVILACGGFYFYSKGLHYEYFKAEEYGSLRLDIRLRNKYKTPEDRYINAFLFRKTGKKYRSVKDLEINFKNNEKKSNKKYSYLQSQKVYLKASTYRLVMNIDEELYQKDFYLEPRITQKKSKATSEHKTIQLNHTSAGRLPLKINYTIRDINLKKNITNDVELFVYHKRWYKWKAFTKFKAFDKIFTSGKTYKFRFTHNDYFSTFLRIAVKPYQTVLTIEAEMVPVPGILVFKSNYNGLDVLINNSTKYYTGGKNRTYSKINPSSKRFQKLVLPPGDYFFTVKKSSSVTKTVKTTIKSKKSTRIIINYNSKKDSLDFKIK